MENNENRKAERTRSLDATAFESPAHAANEKNRVGPFRPSARLPIGISRPSFSISG